MNNKDKNFILQQGQRVFLKATDRMPKVLAVEFVELLKREGSVEKAYLAEGFLEAGEPVHYVIGIKFDEKENQTIESFMETISREFRKIIPENLYVDVIHITKKESPINDFIQNCVIPFYIKGNSGDTVT